MKFFDKNAVENICGCLACVPDKVLLVGNNEGKLNAHCERYHSFFLGRGKDIDFIPKKIQYKEIRYNEIEIDMLSNVVYHLDKIVDEYIDKDTCVIDLTGGQDLMLVAAGIIYERYKDKGLQMHRFNLRNNKLYDCDKNKEAISFDPPELSAEELVRLYGGAIVYENEKPGTTYPWEWSEDFEHDIDMMWMVCKRRVGAWNRQISVFAEAEEENDSPDPLVTTADIAKLKERVKKEREKYDNKRAKNDNNDNRAKNDNNDSIINDTIISKLQKYGLISFYSDEESISITYKNEQVKRCLTKAGQALEMKITLSAKRARNKDGSPVYNDVVNGAYIDWDNKLDEEGYDTDNEIDVLLMRGTVPVFVSCKNGWVETDELYKLDTVAERFGGNYAKKVLVATALNKKLSSTKSFEQRAHDMDITLVDDILNTIDEDLEKAVSKFWSGGGNPKKRDHASQNAAGIRRRK